VTRALQPPSLEGWAEPESHVVQLSAGVPTSSVAICCRVREGARVSLRGDAPLSSELHLVGRSAIATVKRIAIGRQSGDHQK
jgi:hypothetical protein